MPKSRKPSPQAKKSKSSKGRAKAARNGKPATNGKPKNGKLPFSLHEGLALGSKGPDVSQMQKYLKKFGYLEADTPATAAFAKQRDIGLESAALGTFDDATERALKKFQAYYGLSVTGQLDTDTMHLATLPRCGNPDTPNRFFQMTAAAGVAEFVAQGNRWNKSNVTYSFSNFTGDLTQQIIIANIRRAFQAWSAVCFLTFTEVAGTGDIAIAFRTGNHGDGSPFDGPGNVLAHGFYPPPNGGSIAGDLHFDDGETWTTNNPPTGIDFLSVAIHEIGHTLGLDHSADANAIMFAFYSGIKQNLAADDINGIRSIYGSQSAKSILSDTSITSPSFCTFNNRGYIAWAGTDTAHRLNVMATDTLRVWYGKVTMGDTSESGPALAVFNNRLYIAWRGVGNNRLNVMSSADGITWTNKVTLNDTTFHRPALAVWNNRLILGWTGTDSARRLNIIQSGNGITWTSKLTLNDTSVNGPDLCALGANLLICWTGTDAGRRLNVMAFNGSTWFNKVTLGENSFVGPSIDNVGGNVILGWTGTDTANRLNTLRSTNGVNFFGKRTFGDTSSFGPTVSAIQTSPVIAWTGKDNAHSLNVMRI
ncbi:MAG TPA: matrixin family metalloprotease [Pyrinomonadaceae bacterium]|nr:matrixin family metalloprotease [Pyrinomonadaceae bacterium]